MDEKLKSNLTSSKHWLRFVYMILFAVFLQVGMTVMWALVVIQFFFALITGKDNSALRRVCDSLSTYIYQLVRFLTYNTEDKPFPFGDWPEPVAAEPIEGEFVPESEANEEVVEAEPAAEEATDEKEVEAELVEPESTEAEPSTETAPESNDEDEKEKPAS